MAGAQTSLWSLPLHNYGEHWLYLPMSESWASSLLIQCERSLVIRKLFLFQSAKMLLFFFSRHPQIIKLSLEFEFDNFTDATPPVFVLFHRLTKKTFAPTFYVWVENCWASSFLSKILGCKFFLQTFRWMSIRLFWIMAHDSLLRFKHMRRIMCGSRLQEY